jgi:hypothetical protein
MRKRHLMMPLAGLAITAGALLSAGITAGPASAAASSGCPTSTKGLPTDNQVSASSSDNPLTKTTTYQFSSLAHENPVGGLPGLMKYCVYPSSNAQPTKITVDPQAKGDNGVLWTTGTGSNNFAFVRPGGNPSNIGLNNQDVTMGTAKWNTLPATQAIVLHVNDPSVCASLYAGSTSPTCFVLPGPPRQVGPVCDKGDGFPIAAYNANPTDVVNCLNPATGFEATSTNEFGDRVTLDPATPVAPGDVQLKVDFQSFACGDSGHWSGTTQDQPNPPLSPCVTTPGETFQVPGGITANLYDPSNLTTPIATKNINPDILFRPSADSVNNGTHCTGPLGAVDASNKWFNPNGVPGHQCQNSIGQLLTFDFGPMLNLPKDVVWTVAFNTSTSGYAPQGTNTQCEIDLAANDQNPGCGYDSLNVGDHTFPAAPFAGSDPNVFEVYASQGGMSAPLQATTSYFLPDPNSYRPLGEIIAH